MCYFFLYLSNEIIDCVGEVGSGTTISWPEIVVNKILGKVEFRWIIQIFQIFFPDEFNGEVHFLEIFFYDSDKRKCLLVRN